MLDLETLGKQNNSVILTIGAQLFDPSVRGWETRQQRHIHTGNMYDPYLNIKVDVDEQESLGRSIDQETLNWWAKQSTEAQNEAFSLDDRMPLKAALSQLIRLAEPCKRVWSKGILFDFAILEHAIEQSGQTVPWKFWNVMDARTVFALTPSLKPRANGHLAIEDCRNQILQLQESFELLDVKQLK